MKQAVFLIFFLLISFSLQSKEPTVYVIPAGGFVASSTSGDQEVTFQGGNQGLTAYFVRAFQKNKACSGIVVSGNRRKADYQFTAGNAFLSNWTVYGRDGNVIGSGSTKLTKNSVKDACVAIKKDWQERERSNTQ